MRSWKRLAAGGLLAGQAACATPHMRMPALPAFDQGPEAAYNGVCHGASCKAGYNAAHHQYFDERRRRYYWFDPARNRYFWEDGSPYR